METKRALAPTSSSDGDVAAKFSRRVQRSASSLSREANDERLKRRSRNMPDTDVLAARQKPDATARQRPGQKAALDQFVLKARPPLARMRRWAMSSHQAGFLTAAVAPWRRAGFARH
ncbi:hypothetical protein VXQ18_06255 [Brucella abortus]|nr:hypothetical protein [Brucella abortus]